MYKKNSKFTKKIFGKIIRDWYQNHKETAEWNYYTSKDKAFVRNQILGRGRADFNKTFKEGTQRLELNQDDKVILYCYYYMQFHYTSSLYVYCLAKGFLKKNFIDNKHLIFMDIGCGALTSGFAFLEFFDRLEEPKKMKLVYVGADIAKAMIKRGKMLLKAITKTKNGKSYYFGDDFKKIPLNLDRIVDKRIGKGKKRSVIINLSYFLAAHGLKIDEFIEVLEKIFEYFKKDSICIIYQNPPSTSLNQNWEKIKQHFKKFRSLKNCPGELSVKFNDETGSWLPYTQPNRKVYYDFLYNGK